MVISDGGSHFIDKSFRNFLKELGSKYNIGTPYHPQTSGQAETKRWHDHRIKQKEFKEGDKVLLFNSKVKLFGEGKLRSKWKGSHTTINTSSHGAITIQDDEGNGFKVNGQRLKVFLEPSYNPKKK